MFLARSFQPLSDFASLFMSLRFPAFVIRNGASRKYDRTLRIAKGERSKSGRKRVKGKREEEKGARWNASSQ